MPIEERWNIVKKAGVCFQCLGPHHIRSCTSTICPTCGKAHHSSLHRNLGHQLSPFATPYHPRDKGMANSSAKWNPSNRQHVTHQNFEMHSPQGQPHYSEQQTQQYAVTTRGYCYNSTALVIASNGLTTQPVRLLIDGGSDSSYIRSSVADH